MKPYDTQPNTFPSYTNLSLHQPDGTEQGFLCYLSLCRSQRPTTPLTQGQYSLLAHLQGQLSPGLDLDALEKLRASAEMAVTILSS